MRVLLLLLGLYLTLFTTGCETKNRSQVHKIHYDRDMCARCAMVVSDRKNSVEVINPENGKYYLFDDIGCTVLWFDDEHITWQDNAIIWVTDAKSGEWIDARKAYYDTENITPMAYGFSAHKSKEDIEKEQEIIDYNEVVKRVKKIGR